jgi:mRNA interferase MazF
VICDLYEIVVVPFPFTQRSSVKRRPALALSPMDFNGLTGNTLFAMITSSENDPWPLDFAFDYQTAGLSRPCVVRFKLFTLDNRVIIKRIGELHRTDRPSIRKSLRELLPID